MRRVQKKKSQEDLPKWLRWLLIVVAVMLLLAVMFRRQGPMRERFPLYRTR